MNVDNDQAVARLLQEQFDREERNLRRATQAGPSTGLNAHPPQQNLPDDTRLIDPAIPDFPNVHSLTDFAAQPHPDIHGPIQRPRGNESVDGEIPAGALSVIRFMSRRLQRRERRERREAQIRAGQEPYYSDTYSDAGTETTRAFDDDELPAIHEAHQPTLDIRTERDAPPSPPRRRQLARFDDFDLTVVRSPRLRDCMLAITQTTLRLSSTRVRHSPSEIIRMCRTLPPQESVRFAYFLRAHEYDTHVFFKYGADNHWRLLIRIAFDDIVKTYTAPFHPRGRHHPQNCTESDSYRSLLSMPGDDSEQDEVALDYDLRATEFARSSGRRNGDVWW